MIINNYIQDLLKDSPALLSAGDLVKIGLFPSKAAIYKSRDRGLAPPSIEISPKKIRFPRNSLENWLETRGLSE